MAPRKPTVSGSRATSEPVISTVLRDVGFVGDAAEQARSVLEAAGLTRSGKTRIALEKIPRVLEVLATRFSQYCGSQQCLDLLRALKPDSQPVVVQSDFCAGCGGSDLREIAMRLGARLKARLRVVVVGGSPRGRDELAHVNVSQLDLRLVDGLERRTIEQARADRDWADLVVVLGSSELKHKVSNLYRDRKGERKVLVVAGRGAASALAEVERWLSRRTGS